MDENKVDDNLEYKNKAEDNSTDNDRLTKSEKVKKEVIEWIKSLASAVIIALIIVKFIFAFTVVDGRSMMPTLLDRDRLIELKFDKYFRSFKRGDIVVIKDKIQTDGNYYVKRIVGLPGEQLQLINGNVYIDGKILEEDYTEDGIFTEGDVDIKLGDDEYFVMGDNRQHLASRDSRAFGPIKKDTIGGRCVFRIFPFGRFGKLD